eukprot:m.77257 g.77257  ORF g.77257 m.77257 type:complete len:323 (-) comp19097_c0_seq2:1557-2525(-)
MLQSLWEGRAAPLPPSRKRRHRSPENEDEGQLDEGGVWGVPDHTHAHAAFHPAVAMPVEDSSLAGWMPPTPPRVKSPVGGDAPCAGAGAARMFDMKRCRGKIIVERHRPVTRVAVLPPPTTERTTQLYTPWLRQLAHTGVATHIEKEFRGRIHLDACVVESDSDPLLSSALVSLSIDAFGDARYALELALGHNPRTVELWALAVHTELLAGSVDVARDRLAAMRSDVCSAESWLLSADLELYLGDNARAVDLLLEAVDLFPSEAALWLLLGSVWERRKQVNEAREAYGRAIASDCHEPDDESLHAALTRVGTCHGTSWLTSS